MRFPRSQKLYAIRRDDKFFAKGGAWTPNIEQAFISPEKVARGKVRMDIGMPCDLIEVYPRTVPDTDPIPVE